MIKKKCERCGKPIEGYTVKQVDYLIKQHQLSKICKEKSSRND